jgi:uncharacterized sulfatase
VKRISVLILLAVAVVAGSAWNNRIDILISIVKFQSAKQFAHVAPSREVPWQHGPETAPVAAGERAPNIILIVADDLGFNDISTFGGGVDNGRIKTPSIDRLAAEGAVFQQSYSGASTCAPSRAMMMTGRYPTRTGFEFTPTPSGMGSTVNAIYDSMENGLPPTIYDASLEEGGPPYELKGLPASEVTIAEILKSRGYYTAHIGKWHLGNADGMRPDHQGFDDSLLQRSALHLPEDDPNVVNAKLPFDPIDKFLWARGGYANSFNSEHTNSFAPSGYLADYWTDESIKVIKANKNRPFFLYLAHWGIHTPLQATREDYEAVGDIKPHRKRVYAAMVRSVDRSVGRILDALKEQGLEENTIVAFTSDNGGPGYVGLPDINAPYRGWKITMFEGGIRVPLFIKWPQKIAPGTRVDTPVAHIDIAPTFAAGAGAPLPANVEVDGLNLLPLVTGDGAGDWNRETLFWQNGHYKVVRHGDWKLQLNDRPTDGLHKWLFNLKDDPTERNNQAEVHPDKLAELEQLLTEHQAESAGPLWHASGQLPVMIDKSLAETFEPGDEYIYTPN